MQYSVNFELVKKVRLSVARILLGIPLLDCWAALVRVVVNLLGIILLDSRRASAYYASNPSISGHPIVVHAEM